MKRLLALLLAMVLALSLFGCGDVPQAGPYDGPQATQTLPTPPTTQPEPVQTQPRQTQPADPVFPVEEDGWYYSAEDVAMYLIVYGCLPGNFITKDEARDLGWQGGSVEVFAPGFAIGGDRFSNWEGFLPRAPGRQYFECDIDTDGRSSRGARRLVYSNDGLIYYTEDHYETFILLYGEE